MESDHFFVSKFLDGELNGANSRCALLYELQGIFAPWSYDAASITCPTFLYYETDGEVAVAHGEQNQRLIANSQLVVWPQHGHCSILMEFEGIVMALVEGRAAEAKYE